MKNGSSGGTTKQPFELVGGHPALDLVNTLDWRFREGQQEDSITGYADVVRFVGQCGLMTAPEGRRLIHNIGANKGAQVAAKARELREAAARIFYSAVDGEDPPVETIRELEHYFKDAEAHRLLRRSESHWRWDFPALVTAELPLWILSLETAQLITSASMKMLRACGNPECRWLFLDASKNHTRRWCDMKICGNRMKARRFKAQHR